MRSHDLLSQALIASSVLVFVPPFHDVLMQHPMTGTWAEEAEKRDADAPLELLPLPSVPECPSGVNVCHSLPMRLSGFAARGRAAGRAHLQLIVQQVNAFFVTFRFLQQHLIGDGECAPKMLKQLLNTFGMSKNS